MLTARKYLSGKPLVPTKFNDLVSFDDDDELIEVGDIFGETCLFCTFFSALFNSSMQSINSVVVGVVLATLSDSLLLQLV